MPEALGRRSTGYRQLDYDCAPEQSAHGMRLARRKSFTGTLHRNYCIAMTVVWAVQLYEEPGTA